MGAIDSSEGRSQPAPLIKFGRVIGPDKHPGKPFARLERWKNEKAVRDEQKRLDAETRRDRRAARDARKPLTGADQGAGASPARTGTDADHGVAFGRARTDLQRKARRLGLNLQTVKGLRPLSEAASLIGKKRFLDTICLAMVNGDEAAKAWWKTYDGLDEYSKDLRHIIFDEIAVSAGVRPDDLLKAVVGAAVTYGARTNELVYAMMSPKVVKAMATSAARVDMRTDPKILEIAQKDRQSLLQGKGFLTARSGPSININTNASAAAAAKAEAASVEPTVPSFLDDVSSLEAPKADVQRRLQAVTVVEGDAE